MQDKRDKSKPISYNTIRKNTTLSQFVEAPKISKEERKKIEIDEDLILNDLKIQ